MLWTEGLPLHIQALLRTRVSGTLQYLQCMIGMNALFMYTVSRTPGMSITVLVLHIFRDLEGYNRYVGTRYHMT